MYVYPTPRFSRPFSLILHNSLRINLISVACESIKSNLKALNGDRSNIHTIMPSHAGWKGKTRAVDVYNKDEGIGGASGIVLSLDNGGSDV